MNTSRFLARLLSACLIGIGGARVASAGPPSDAIETFADRATPTRVLHVATSGNDQGGDGSEGRPYATIAAAARRAKPGTRVLVHPGTYRGGVGLEGLAGEARAPIWIGGEPNASPRPIIDGGGSGIHLVRASYVVLHDLEVRGATGNGVNSDDGGAYADDDAAHHQVFQRLRIDSIGADGNQDGLKLSGIRGFTVLDCEISRCGGAMSGSGIDMVGCHDGTIARCFLHDLSANAVQAKGGTADVTITRCRMERAGERAVNIGGSTGFEFFRPPLTAADNAEARRVVVSANVILGGACAAAFVGAVDCSFSQNTVIRPETWTLRILQETVSTTERRFLPCSRNRVTGNIFVFARATLRTHLNIGANTDPASFTFAHNCWFASDDAAWSKPVLPVAEVGGLYGADPRVCEDNEWSLAPDSPCLGRVPSVLDVRSDYAGAPYATPGAMGARERAPSTP
jgi:hypothetical protein